MFAGPTEQVSQGLTFDWDQAEKDVVATGNIDKKTH
jgi:hypothetical protein